MVVDMAKFLGKTLSVKDPGVQDAEEDGAGHRGSAWALVQLMHEQFRYLPTKRVMNFLDELYKAWMFAEMTEQLARSMLISGEDASPGTLACVTLHEYALHPAYYGRMDQSLCSSTTTVILGDVGRRLEGVAESMAYEWLLTLDEAICGMLRISRTERRSGRAGDEVKRLARQFSSAIAKRHALTQCMSESMLEVDPLSTRVLESWTDAEFLRTTVQAETRARVDLEALGYLLTIAKFGPSCADAEWILKHRLAHLRHIVWEPPVELVVHDEPSDGMNVALLRRMLQTHVTPDVRSLGLQHWSDAHGACACTAIAEAMKKIKAWSPRMRSPFIPMVTRNKTSLEVPPISWSPDSVKWYFLETRTTERTGLDADGERIVSFTSAVWELVAKGAFRNGVLVKPMVDAVAMEVLLHADYIKVAIDNHRKQTALGTHLHEALEALYGHGSEDAMADSVAAAMCELRAYSAVELMETFDPRNKTLRNVLPALSMHARRECTANVPPEYTHFAMNALELFLPLICIQREKLTVHQNASPNEIGEVLRSIPGLAARAASSKRQAIISISADEVQKGHPATRQVLDEAVRRRCPVLGCSHLSKRDKTPLKRKVSFWFDRIMLLTLLKM